MSFLEASQLSKNYGQDQAQVRALRQVSFSLDKGEFVAVMGPSGSGKSTLLAILGALTTPSSGRYLVDGLDIFSLSPDQRADFRREYLGFVFQNFNLVPYLNLAENVMLPLATSGLPKSRQIDMAAQALKRVGLAGKEARLPGQLSGGEQERAAVARALVNRPPLLLADEPTGNLDQANSRQIMDLLAQLSSQGMTIIMVTHSQACAQRAARKLTIYDGSLAGDHSHPPQPLPAAAA